MDLDTLRRAVIQRLDADRRAGLTHLPAADPFPKERLRASDPAAAAGVTPAAPAAGRTDPRGGPTPEYEPPAGDRVRPPEPASPAPPPSTPRPPRPTQTREQRVAALAVLEDRVRGCPRCAELAATRTQTVFGTGDPHAAILFLGEAPGADEDASGVPFVGRAGQLLDRIIAACRLKREEVYITNVLKCRPPNNRNPAPAEAANCREYLDGQLAAVDPDYIVCWGAVAAKSLLDTKEGIGKLRKRFFEHGRAKVACTYHPSYLLRNPAAKKEVWEDMKWLFADMGVELK